MARTKENRSGWVAVQPEFSSGSVGSRPPVKPAKSAYQFFQKKNGSSIHGELSSSGAPCDVGALGREVSSRWQALPPAEKCAYEEMAERDRMRYASESRERDAEALERTDRLRRERETLILDDVDGEGGGQGGGRATRRARMKKQRKAERKKVKREEKEAGKKRKAAAAVRKDNKARASTLKKDDDSDYDDDDVDDNDSDDNNERLSGDQDGSPSSADDDDDDSTSSSSPSSSNDDSDDSSTKKHAAKRPPPKVSQAVLDRRERAREEKLQKERYIQSRQSDVRGERAEQAKRRLEFLLKQSDIFGHFGNVKQERARLGLSSTGSGLSAADASSHEGEGGRDGGIRKAAAVVVRGVDGEEADEEERMEADEHEATYLTSQPSTMHGQMRQYQLEGLNVSVYHTMCPRLLVSCPVYAWTTLTILALLTTWQWMIRLQENGVNGNW